MDRHLCLQAGDWRSGPGSRSHDGDDDDRDDGETTGCVRGGHHDETAVLVACFRSRAAWTPAGPSGREKCSSDCCAAVQPDRIRGDRASDAQLPAAGGAV